MIYIIRTWIKVMRIRMATRKYVAWKAEREAMERLGGFHCAVNSSVYVRCCSNQAWYEERLEQLIRG